MKRIIMIILLFTIKFNAFNQTKDFNFDFERKTTATNLPDNWIKKGNGNYNITTDSLEKYSGKYSVLIESQAIINKEYFGCIAQSIPASYIGNEIEVRAYIKLKNVVNGSIGLLLRIDGEAEVLQFDNMQQKNIQGTSEWKIYSVKLPYPQNAKTINIGAILFGTGKIWVDDFKVLINGKEISEAKLKSQTEKHTKLSTYDDSLNLNIISKEKVENLKTLCMIWGFLKYYHPHVAKGKFDWDNELIQKIKQINATKSKEEINKIYKDWIQSLGKINVCRKCESEKSDYLKSNLDLNWINDTIQLTQSLINQLQFIQQNRNQKKNHYLKNSIYNRYGNEEEYKDSITPSSEMRLLCLFRYWNIINYFYPYKYKIGHDWKDVLSEMIPKFINSDNAVSYNLAILELTAKINDSHTFFNSIYTIQHFGYLTEVPFGFKLIDNKAIVTFIINDSLCKKDDIKYGDAILKVNNKPISQIINENSKYIGASNETMKQYKSKNIIFSGNNDSMKITFERNGIIADKFINRYYYSKLKPEQTYDKKSFMFINKNIGYINLGILKRREVHKAIKTFKNTKAIIIDIRNYPNWTIYKISKYLNNARKPFVMMTYPVLSYPGVFNFEPPLKCGKKNKKVYKGKIILLFNEETISQAEFTVMALQTLPNVISIGSQTAGSDGNVSLITLPGGYRTQITGLGVYYPNGRETQRIGIVPDIEVKPTIEGIRNNKDELLEKALEIIN